MDWKYEYLIEQIHRTAYKKHEAFIIGKLLHDEELADLMPVTQHYVRRMDSGYALIDLFYPQLNVAVEIDEPHHMGYVESDRQRQESIAKNIECEFHRISVSLGNIMEQVHTLKLVLLSKRNKLKESGELLAWEAPRFAEINELQNELKKTLFIKIRGDIEPDQLLARQTGYWRIAKEKAEKVCLVVIIHDGKVTRAFDEISFHRWTEHPEKTGFSGIENDHHELVGTIVRGWTSQQTITYSSDLY